MTVIVVLVMAVQIITLIKVYQLVSEWLDIQQEKLTIEKRKLDMSAAFPKKG